MTEESVTTFVSEAEAVGAGVVRASQDELTGVVARLLEGDRSAVVAAGLTEIVPGLVNRGIDALCEGAHETDREGGAEALPKVDAGVVMALLAVADTGTLLVGPGSGLEGVLTILPPHCVAVVHTDRIEPDLSTALDAAASLVAVPGSRLVFITGPSRTSDIELTPVVGVHGPLRLDIVIVDD